MASKLECALLLAARGFHVFPLEAGRKAPPRIDEFPCKASRDPDQIRRWWTDPVLGWEQDFNIGVSTSRYGAGDSLLVIDIDNKGGKHGSETVLHLTAEGYLFPGTLTVRTPTGGFHLIYRTPIAVRQNAGALGSGLDVRSFGGYIVAAGSTVGAGTYTEDPGTKEPTVAPAWLVAACGLCTGQKRAAVRVPVVAGASRAENPAIDPERALARAMAYLASLPPIQEGERNSAGFRVANTLKDSGVAQDVCEHLLETEWRCNPPLSSDEIGTLVRSAYRATLTAPGSAAPEVQFTPVSTDSGHSEKVDNSWLRAVLDFCRSSQ